MGILVEYGFAKDRPCGVCGGDGIVCENHPHKSWDHLGCECGAGMPCQVCTKPVLQDGTHSISECFVSHPVKQ